MSTHWKLMTYENVFLTIRETSFHIYSFDLITTKWLNELLKTWSFMNVHCEKKNILSNKKIDWILTQKVFEKFDKFFQNKINEHKQYWLLSLCKDIKNTVNKKFIENMISELIQEYTSKDKELNETLNFSDKWWL